MSPNGNMSANKAQAGVEPAAISRILPFPVPVRMAIDVVKLTDVVLVVLAAILAREIYLETVLEANGAFGPYVTVGCIIGVILHQVARLQGLYDPTVLLSWRRHLWKLYSSILLSFLIVIAFGYLLKVSATYSRGWMLLWIALCFVLLTGSRLVAARALIRLAATGAMARRAVVVVPGAAAEGFLEELRNTPDLVLSQVLFVDLNKPDETTNTVRSLINAGQRGEFDEVIVAISDNLSKARAQLLEPLRVLSADVWVYMAELSMPVHNVARLGEATALQVRRRAQPMREWNFVVKGIFDYVGAVILLLLAWPVMLMAAIAIKLDSRGPVFFVQKRNGYNQRVINVIKFRTMDTRDQDVVVQARRGDPRITRVGRILRATSIDELPQLFNVLKGEMSLVGPRPHAVSHNELYERVLEHYRNRHMVKPGITGLAQVNGFRGPTEELDKMRKRIEYDLEYIENWSIWLDIKILARTVVVALTQENAI